LTGERFKARIQKIGSLKHKNILPGTPPAAEQGE
jgi:hypothetical protein